MNSKFKNEVGNIVLTDKQMHWVTQITGLSNNNKCVNLFDRNSDKWADCGLSLELTNSRAIRINYEGAEFKDANLMDIVFNNNFKKYWRVVK